MSEELINQKLVFLSKLNELDARLFLGIWALEEGWGGISKVNKLTGKSMTTIRKGIFEIQSESYKKLKDSGRIRKEGGGRKRIIDKNPKIKTCLENILRDNTAGDPMRFLIWTNKSLSNISKELKNMKHNMSRYTVRRILLEEGYTLQSNKKSKGYCNSPKRDSQFKYINAQIEEFSNKNQPVISVDTKKKELIGEFKNPGKRWLKKGQAEIVNVYDFESLAKGKAIPYGIYEVLKNNGFVNVGISADTAEFAVNSINRWWKNIGIKNYPTPKELLICADGGGSNGSRSKLWKYYLQQFANEAGLKITVCHYPPGTSKWNKIEHKMFSFISMNWKGKPFTSYKVIINLIQGTRTEKGLKIKAKLDRRKYKKGKKILREDMKKIKLMRHTTNPEWNYTIMNE